MNDDALPCRAAWFHNETPVPPGSSPRRPVTEDPITGEFRLAVKGLQITDDGEWSVEVQNDLGKVGTQCRLTLKGKEKKNLSKKYYNPHDHLLTSSVPKNYRKPVFVEKLRANLTDEGLVSFECKVISQTLK